MEKRIWETPVRMRPLMPLVLFLLLCLPTPSFSIRIKDIAEIEGVRGNQLIGYGLVVGLKGTGDKMGTDFTLQSLVNLLERMGISVNKEDVSVKNIAAVMVTAELPPFAKVGTHLDALVSSIGDAQSLVGGTLLLTPLKGPDGKIYAVAQGPISVGGFAFGGAGGGRAQVNHPTVGRIAGGAVVEEEVPTRFNEKEEISISLHRPDFTTVTRVVQVINHRFQMNLAEAIDAGTARIKIPGQYQGHLAMLLSKIESMEVIPDARAKVVLNERTGTVVMGENVRVSLVAISHGNLSVIIKERPQVSQPLPFAPSPLGGETTVTEEGITVAPGGQTVVTPDTEIQVAEEEKRVNIIPRNVSIGELVQALNALGVSPRDLISILQAIKAAGALHAELEII